MRGGILINFDFCERPGAVAAMCAATHSEDVAANIATTAPADGYSKSGNSSRSNNSRIDRPWPGVRAMKPFFSSVTTI